jgi:metal-responsive CopG/Arc/MetJ family transcriptional regulator
MPPPKPNPLLQGTVVSKTVALPEALWEALDRECLLEEAKNRSKFVAGLLAWAIEDLRDARARAAAVAATKK